MANIVHNNIANQLLAPQMFVGHNRVRSYSRNKVPRMDVDPALIISGPAGGGKSTFLKQFEFKNHGGFGEDVARAVTFTILRNVVVSCKYIIDNMRSMRMSCKQREAEEVATEIAALDLASSNNKTWTSRPALFDRIPTLCKDEMFVLMNSEGMAQCDDYKLLGPFAAYFFRDIDRISAANYLATNEDIIRTCDELYGLHDRSITISKTQHRLKLIEVESPQQVEVFGGLKVRNIQQHIDNTNYVVFIAPLDIYKEGGMSSQGVETKPGGVELENAVKDFVAYTTSQMLQSKSFVLVFNKYDLLLKKMAPYKVREAVDFIKTMYVEAFTRCRQTAGVERDLHVVVVGSLVSTNASWKLIDKIIDLQEKTSPTFRPTGHNGVYYHPHLTTGCESLAELCISTILLHQDKLDVVVLPEDLKSVFVRC